MFQSRVKGDRPHEHRTLTAGGPLNSPADRYLQLPGDSTWSGRRIAACIRLV